MKFILLVEMPMKTLISKRVIIKRQLRKIILQEPKRNVFLIEVKKEEELKTIKEWIVENSDPESKVNYYQIVE
jgi:hypothetical protein